MATRESQLWSWLDTNSRHLRRTGLHVVRVENSCGSGFPDVEACWLGTSFTVELKCADRPKREGTTCNFKHMRAGQVIFAADRAKARGRHFLLLQVGSGHEAQRYLLVGTYAAAVLSGLTERAISTYARRIEGTAEAILREAAGPHCMANMQF